MKIITALVNPTLNKKLKEINKFEIIAPDIQYQDAVFEILEEKNNIEFLILSEILPGSLNIYEFINEIIIKNNKLNIIIILENKKEELENFLIRKGIFNIFYNNEITIEEIIKILEEKNNIKNIELKSNSDDKIIKYKIKKKNIIKKNNKKCFIICILGYYESGKSIFCINLSKNIKNKKILIIDFDILNNSIFSILGINKIQNKEKVNINDSLNIKNIIYKFNKNLHLICGIDLLLPNKITNKEIQLLINNLQFNYDYIIIDTSSECLNDTTKFLIKNSDKSIFLLEANTLEIKKSKRLLNIYLEEWYIKKGKINIVFNKYNRNSIKFNLLKIIFSDFKILGKVDYNLKYNFLINKNFKNYFVCNKIKRQYKNILKSINIQRR